jgi:ATP-dependent RNA helicase RhlE
VDIANRQNGLVCSKKKEKEAIKSTFVALVYVMTITFESLKLTRQYLNAIEELGYTSPTEVQQKAIPLILGGQDVIGIAQTGTGKTAAYLLPLMQTLKYAQGEDPRCLILAPTKELVIQIDKNIQELAKYTDLRWVCLYGGIGPKTQIEQLAAGVDIIVGTPGRFLELYAKGVFVAKKIKHMVLDECDRMMDMGFWPQLRDIQEKLPQKKQQLLFSATFPEKVERIADNFLLWPSRIEVTPQATPAATVGQVIYQTPNKQTKANLIKYLLRHSAEMTKVIIFTATKEDANILANMLDEERLGPLRLLHSNKGQNARINAIEDFKTNVVRLLISTDVSARGIDINEVSHVINFNIPTHYEDYVHRIGRTGRAFKTGMAISMYDVSEKYHVRHIEKLIRQTIEEKPLPDPALVKETGFAERQAQNKEIDRQKRLDNPEFKGAFHEKKFKKDAAKDKKKKSPAKKAKPRKRTF